MNETSWSDRDRPMHVLVVDDDADMLALLKANIQVQFGDQASVDSVLDPQTASDRLETGLVDVLVTDLEMPGINGLQLLRHAKRRNAWTQVIVVTGHSATAALTEAMDFGASDYLVKPVELAELEQVLAEAAGRLNRWRQSLARTFVSTDTRR